VRVAFLNNYSTVQARARWQAGTYPSQHLWGADRLEAAGVDVRYIDLGQSPRLARLGRRLGGRLGDLSMQRDARAVRDRTTVVYAADAASARGLAMMRAAALSATPVAVVVHHPFPKGGGAKLVMSGSALVVCLSSRVRDQLVADFGRDADRTPVLPWGPDLDYSGYRSTGDDFVVSCGKTNRDTDTLLAALNGTDIPAKVYVTEEPAVPALAPVQLWRSQQQLEFEEALAELRRSAVVAIPVKDNTWLSGLSELADALALGKPIVMTWNPFVEVDIEAVGCGVWVDPGDVDGWRRALTRLMHDPALRSEMGRRGREYAERACNMRLFGDRLAVELRRLVPGDS
jgi:glycosyltransferase involved in cell wall biosynthesis